MLHPTNIRAKPKENPRINKWPFGIQEMVYKLQVSYLLCARVQNSVLPRSNALGAFAHIARISEQMVNM